ncbi:macro domain-containing protein [Chlamydia sp. 12-01]|uniref:macro domain-containing protein n=1 Tax=Chlamydia sp. 12-01 TaxID=3002742 RepID=UPI0035D43375
MSKIIDTYEASLTNTKILPPAVSSNKSNHRIAKVALALLIASSLIGVVTTLTLAITMSMPSLATAVITFSIIAIVCCILLCKKPTKVAPSFQPMESSENISIPSSVRLLDSWIEIESPKAVNVDQFDPIDSNTAFAGWKLPNSKTTLVSTRGDISKCRFITQGLKPMLVNATNNIMYPRVGGMNKALAKAVNQEGWENSKEGKSRLETGQCSAGKWINPDGSNNDTNPASPAFLAQLSGPICSNINGNPVRCYQEATQAYENCLAKAQEKGSRYLQVPIISFNKHSPPVDLSINGRNIREQWLNSIKSALVTAVQNFAIQNPDYQMIIVVTDTTISLLD